MMPKFITSKAFIIDAYDSDEGKYFFAFEELSDNDKEPCIISIEIVPEDYPHITVCRHDNMKEFIHATTWYDWIKNGITLNYGAIKYKIL